MAVSEAEALAYRYPELLNRGDFNGLADLFSDDAKIWIAGDEYTKESFRELAKGVFQNTHGILMYAEGPHMEPINCFASGSRSVIEVITTGTTRAGNAYVNRYCLVFDVREGKAVSMNEYLDTEVARRVQEGRSPQS